MRKVTVIVTVKNSVHTIEKCIKSIIANRYPKEIVVIDAKSTDGTYELLEKFSKSKKINLISLESNAPKAFNHGIKMAKTPVVALTDADCVVEKDWLKKLVQGISGDHVAAAGSCWTPRGLTGLAKAIGEEFDKRFDIDAQEVTRAPTMNLAFLSNIGKKVLFREDLDIAFETDFCFRMLRHGKIAYVKDARVYHYHRATWKSFFRQQKNYGKYGALVYLKHPKRLGGDHVSRRNFFIQVFLLYLTASAVLGSLLFRPLIYLAALGLLGLGVLFTKELMDLKPSNPLLSLGMISVRLAAWCIGGIEGALSAICK